MGMDIHMYIVKDKQIIKSDIFDGRNTEWFNNIQGTRCDCIYEHFPIYRYDVSDQAPNELINKANSDWYFGHCSIKVDAFKKWFEKYNPDKEAGWITTYDKWKMERQGCIPTDFKYYLSKEDVVEDWHFVEWDNIYDCSRWLYEYLIENKIDNDADITYWFDN